MKKGLMLLAAVALFAVVAVPAPAGAQTIEQLQAMIAELNKQIAALTGCTTAAAGSDEMCGVSFTQALRVGSTGAEVTNVQKVLVSNGYLVMPAGVAYGYYGKLTEAAVKAYQAENALSQVGVVGPMTRAALNASAAAMCKPVVTTPPPTTGGDTPTGLQGGAGDLSLTKITSGTETTVGEGREERVLGIEAKADDNSDIAITSVRVAVDINGGSSSRLNRFVDEVIVYLGDKEVGSVDASDFSRSGDISTATISLKDAVVEADQKVRMYVALVGQDVIDTPDQSATALVSVDRVRFEDASGAILSDDSGGLEALVSFEDGAVNDGARVQSVSSSPDSTILKVKENAASDEYHVFTFRLKGDSSTSDLSVTSLPLTVQIYNASSSANINTDDLIDDVWLETPSGTFDDYVRDSNSVIAAGATENVVYTVSIDEGDFEVVANETEEVKVYVKFGRQSTKYAVGSTIRVSVAGDLIKAENTAGKTVTFSGAATGKVHTVDIAGATVSGYAWSIPSAGNLIDFTFKVEADDEDYTFATSSLTFTTDGPATTSAEGAWAITSGSSNVATSASGYTVAAGEEATFRVRWAVNGTNGQYVDVTLTSPVAGKQVPNDKQTSPTATRNVQS